MVRRRSMFMLCCVALTLSGFAAACGDASNEGEGDPPSKSTTPTGSSNEGKDDEDSNTEDDPSSTDEDPSIQVDASSDGSATDGASVDSSTDGGTVKPSDSGTKPADASADGSVKPPTSKIKEVKVDDNSDDGLADLDPITNVKNGEKFQMTINTNFSCTSFTASGTGALGKPTVIDDKPKSGSVFYDKHFIWVGKPGIYAITIKGKMPGVVGEITCADFSAIVNVDK